MSQCDCQLSHHRLTPCCQKNKKTWQGITATRNFTQLSPPPPTPPPALAAHISGLYGLFLPILLAALGPVWCFFGPVGMGGGAYCIAVRAFKQYSMCMRILLLLTSCLKIYIFFCKTSLIYEMFDWD
jgi:hypothetical protein